ncbi:MAG TPA: CBS domain-containing protein [Steroidobacteraceae bacterium]|nr:CBS domain-containing protein [Steroidobacteraceae bacterium]
MNVGSICKRQIVTVTPRSDLAAAAQLMRDKHVGFLIVVEPEPQAQYGRPVGVLTDRDIVISVVARGADPTLLTAGDVMNREPVLAQESDSVDQALRTMRRMGVRRLPVIGSRGMLTGVLSLDDVLDVLAAEIGEVSGTVRNEQRIEGVLRT